MYRFATRLLLLALLACGSAPAARAQPAGRDHRPPDRAHSGSAPQQGRGNDSATRHLISPRVAAREAQRRFGGRVLSVELEHRGGAPVYRVKLLSGGVVRVVQIPAAR